jgi:hypothetical protein
MIIFKKTMCIGYFLVLFLGLNLLPVKAQVFKGGITTGFSAAQIDGDLLSGYHKLGLIGGLYITTNIEPKLNAQFEIKYVGKGAAVPYMKDNPVVAITGFDYIEFPVSLNYKLHELMILEAGILSGFMVNSYFRDEIGRSNLVDPYRRLDVGFLLGYNYDISDRLKANLRYTYSLRAIRTHQDVARLGRWFYYGDYNNVLNFSLFYLFKDFNY